MDDALKRIIDLAWRTVPAVEANEAIARARRATGAVEQASAQGTLEEEDSAATEDDESAPMARAYEIALAPDATFESFTRDQLPKLIYHLESLGAHLPRAHGVVVCLFSGTELHFIQAGELIAQLCIELKTTPADLSQRYGTHELRTAIRRDDPPANPAHTLALAPPEKKS